MYFSKQYKFCFMHINKTGGRSLTNYLKQIVPDIRLTGFGNKAIHKPYGWLKGYNLIPSSYLIVTIVRNPWARYESLYRYRRMKHLNPRYISSKQDDFAWHTEFNDWFNYTLRSSNPLDRPQAEWFPKDEKLRDQVVCLRLEHIESDLSEMLKAFGIDESGAGKFPHINKSPVEDIEWAWPNSLELRKREEYIIKNFYNIGGDS